MAGFSRRSFLVGLAGASLAAVTALPKPIRPRKLEEALSDYIYRIDPVKSPFFMAHQGNGKGKVRHEWAIQPLERVKDG